jgi:hypothetical protein
MKFAKFFLLIVLTASIASSCGKEYSSEELRPVLGNWQFMQGGVHYSGYLDNVYRTQGIGSNVLYIIGTSDNGSQQLQIKLFGSSFPIGSYSSTEFQNTFSYSLPNKTIYYADETTGEFIVNLTAVDSTNILGTFSGTVYDSAYNEVQITNGKFSTY